MRKERNYTELVFLISSFAMLFIFTGAFIYYILYKEILIYLSGIGFLAFLIGFSAKKRMDSAEKN